MENTRKISNNAKKLASALKETNYYYTQNNIMNNFVEMIKLGYPVLTSYQANTLKFLESVFIDKKKVMKFIRLSNKLHDANEFELNLKSPAHRNLISILEYDNCVKFYNKIIGNKYSFHDIVSNIPNLNVEENKDCKSEIFNFLMKIFDYSLENTYQVLPYAGYSKVRKCDNFEQMMKKITIIEMKKNGYKDDIVFPSNLILQKHLRGNALISFSKEGNIVFNIGRETNCCFKKGGVGESLLKPALESPISGVLYGNLGSRWFSFIWEIVEFNKETGLIEKNLVLDNIEARKVLSQSEFDILLKTVSNLGYNRVYCGFCRNDIPTLPETISKTIKDKPYHLIGYEKAFEKYGTYDDSRRIYTFFEEDELSNKAYIRRMDYADLHRCAYLERLLWKSNTDKDFIKINVEESPSYVIDNDTNIFGYFVTEMRYFERREDGELVRVQGKKLHEWKCDNLGDEKPEYDGLEKIIYISDMFAIKNRHVIKSFESIFKDLEKWCRENNITKISSNPNSFSSPFLKRLKNYDGIEYIDEGISSFTPSLDFKDNLNNKIVTSVECNL